MLPPAVRAKLDALPDDALVLDVGGWARPDPRADWVIDIGSYETRNYYARELGEAPPAHEERFSRETWVEADICATTPWPFADGMFAFAICVQTLEDIRDPLRACEEMARVARAGFVATPLPEIELTRGIESRHWCGWHHHRWLVERDGDGLVFVAKPHHIHSPLWPAIRSPRYLRAPNGAVELEWDGTLRARERILVHHADLERYLADTRERAARPDPTGRLLLAARGAGSGAYGRARGAAGRALRRGGAAG